MSTFAVLAVPLHDSATFGAFIKCYHKPFFFFFFPPSEQHSYICKKNFSSRARAPLRQHRAACLMRSRCEETWEAEMMLESLSHSVNWCLQLANTDSWNTWVFLFYFLSIFFFFFTAGVFDVSCRHRGRVVSTHDVTGPHWALESSFDGPLMKCGGLEKKSSTDACCLFLLKLPLPLDNLGFSLVKSLSEKSRLCS